MTATVRSGLCTMHPPRPRSSSTATRAASVPPVECTIRIDRPHSQSLGEGRAMIAQAGECSALESSAAADSTSAGERVSCADTICT
jgi:hypothetical protein